ncbi:MAG: metalloregulator ArsR/SmtB family transcription factor [Deltaproteobacteria bacterium]|jgi:ArsR family transcriptional regulator|nr:metalloregulator ArsR/SmtB family transcription factor [Deltaproteobacteria bacterium]
MLDFINITKALTDENRLRILLALRNRELCVCQITAMLDLAPSTTSKHLSVLRQARLIESTKHGKWVYYHLIEPKNSGATNEKKFVLERQGGVAAREALDLTIRSLEDHPAILRDEERFLEILQREGVLYAGMEENEMNRMHSPAIHSLARDEE